MQKTDTRAKERIKIIGNLHDLMGRPLEQVELLKRSTAMVDPELWSMVHEVLAENSDPDISKLMADGDLLQRIHSQVLDNAHKLHYLLGLGWETILASFATYLEYNYFESPSDDFFDNRRPNLLAVLQRVAQEKVEHFRESWGGKPALDRALKMVRSRLLRGKSLDTYALFDAWDVVLEVENIIENYCLKGWDVICDEEVFIRPKEDVFWDNWTITNHKFQLIDLFYQSMPFLAFQEQVENIIQNSPNEESALSFVSGLGGKAFLMDMLGTLEVSVDGAEINLSEVVDIMKIFDTRFKRNYLPFMKKMKDSGLHYSEAIIETEQEQIERNIHEFIRKKCNLFDLPNQIMKMIHPPCIESRTRDEMLMLMTEYDSVEPDSTRLRACEVALNLFSAPPHMNAVENGQFLRAPDKSYIVMPRFFHGDVKTTILNILTRKKKNNKIFSVEMEKSLQWMFSEQGYTTILNWNYPSGDDFSNGEIDVLAYKDRFLFILEAKFTYFRTQNRSIYDHRDKLCEGGRQLKRAMRAIPANFVELKKALEIGEEYESLVVVPLLVSSSPEFDYDQFSEIDKISVFEMKGLLDPEMFVLLQALIAMYNNQTELGMTTERGQQEHIRAANCPDCFFSLEMARAKEQYSSKADLIASQPDKLVEAIKSRVFWKKLDENPEIVRGQIESTLTLRNGDKVRYVT